MCGILASINFRTEISSFKNALALMKHRGPDQPGNIINILNGKALLGQNRLAIIDLDHRSDQPFISRDEQYAISYNGEIYNYKELISKYDLDLRTQSDTELILELYIKYGEKILSEFIGMFSFIIINLKTAEIFVARDRLGVKPLYVWRGANNSLIFSSEIYPIISLTKQAKIDPLGQRQYQYLRTFFNNRTLYSGISSFPAGSYLKNDRLQKYWEYPNTEQTGPTDEELLSLINKSVQYRMVSDVPVGSFLSGGLDSSIITGLARVKQSWSVGTPDNNEFEWADIVARHFHTDHTNVVVDDNTLTLLLREMIKLTKTPVTVPNSLLIYAMCKVIKKKNKVVLCGEGADELFFGYDRIFKWANKTKKFDLVSFAKLYAYGTQNDYEIIEDAIAPFMKYGTTTKIVQAFFQNAHLHGLLQRLDQSTMLQGIEARAPFTDHRLIERMAGVNYLYNYHNSVVKAPLKRIYGSMLPEAITQREKVGFPVQLKTLYRDIDKPCFDDWTNNNLAILKEDI